MENLWISTLCLAIQGFELFYFFGKGILILSSQNSVITLVPLLVDIRSKLDDLNFNIDFDILKMKKNPKYKFEIHSPNMPSIFLVSSVLRRDGQIVTLNKVYFNDKLLVFHVTFGSSTTFFLKDGSSRGRILGSTRSSTKLGL